MTILENSNFWSTSNINFESTECVTYRIKTDFSCFPPGCVLAQRAVPAVPLLSAGVAARACFPQRSSYDPRVLSVSLRGTARDK